MSTTPQPPSAEKARVNFYGEGDSRAYDPDEIKLMHTHTREWLKYFAEKIKGDVGILTIGKLDALLYEVTKEMEEGK